MIKDNLDKVFSQIQETAKGCGRNPSEIKLVSASKYADAKGIREAFEAGVRIFGENKVQEAFEKQEFLKDLPIEWQMIGHLQSNKAKLAVKLFSLIHSVDSLGLAQEINKQAAKLNKLQDILIEVNTTGEGQKSGINPEELLNLIKSVTTLKNLKLKGLMTMGKFVENSEVNRQYFKRLKQLFDDINQYLQSVNCNLLTELSMGMTDDFKVAIEEGSTMVRIGRAIWENR